MNWSWDELNFKCFNIYILCGMCQRFKFAVSSLLFINLHLIWRLLTSKPAFHIGNFRGEIDGLLMLYHDLNLSKGVDFPCHSILIKFFLGNFW